MLIGLLVGFLAGYLLGRSDWANGGAAKNGNAALGLHVASAHGRSTTMPVERPSVSLVDVEKVLLSIAPKDADNRDVPVGGIVWSSSDESVITLEPAADDAGNDLPGARWARSGAPGSAVVSVAADNGLAETITLIVTVGEPSALNLSAGTPVPE